MFENKNIVVLGLARSGIAACKFLRKRGCNVIVNDRKETEDESILKEIEQAKKELSEGNRVFSGVIYDNTGVLQCDEGESISDEILLEKMDWFVDGVVIHE